MLNQPKASYPIPRSSYYRQYKAEGRGRDDPGDPFARSGLDLLFIKICLDQDSENGDQEAIPRNQFIIVQCIFESLYVKYYPEMFINICQNFLLADQELRSDINILLQIAAQIGIFSENSIGP